MRYAVRNAPLRFALVLFVCLFVTSRARAEIPAEWVGQRVVSVEIVGAAKGLLDPERETGIEPGGSLTRTLVREAIKRLMAEGQWADVQVSARPAGGGVVLLFQLVSRLVAQRVEVVGNRLLDDREIMRLSGLREELEIEETAFAKWTSVITEAYRAKGYRSAEVKVALRDTDDPGRKVVRIEVREGPPTLISEIVFLGDPLPKRKGLSRVLRVDVGDVANEEVLRHTLDEATGVLRNTGFYAAAFGEPKLEIVGQRARVLIPSSIGAHYEVQFSGASPLTRRELLRAMKLKDERLMGASSFFAYQNRIVDLYRRHGFAAPEVTIHQYDVPQPEGAPRDHREILLAVEIRAGAQFDVVRVSFPGARHFDDEFLREQVYSYLEENLPGSSIRMPVDSDVADRLGFGGGTGRATREVAKPALADPRRMFYGPAYAQAIEHLHQLYLADGYLAVQIGEPVVEPLDEPGTGVVVIPIVEGPRTLIYELHVEGNDKLSTFELLEASGLERGTPFSHLKLEEARVRLLDRCQEAGFYYATVEPTVRMAEDGTRADIVFRVAERFPVRVGGIEVRGNERSSSSMIMNRTLLRTGQLYRPSLARDTQDALLALDVFTSVSVAPDEVDLPARVKTVVITVNERKTQYLGWNGGVSTGEGTRGGFEYGYRNLFGSAVHATFRTQLGYQLVFLDNEIKERYETLSTSQRIEYQTTLSFGFPYIPYLPKNTVSVDFTVLSDIQRDFRIQKEDVVGTVVYRPLRRLTLTFAEQLEKSDFLLLAPQLDNPNISLSNLVPDGVNTLVASQLTATLDLRDRINNPRRGILVTVSPEYDRTLAAEAGRAAERMTTDEGELAFKSNMLRLLGSFAFYIPLLEKLTFASQWRYGRIVHLESGSSSYPNRLFYLGGTNFRGYYVNQVVPKGLPGGSENLVSHGGEVVFATQSELRFPLYRELFGGLFTDIGNLWAKPDVVDLRELEYIVGAGLRFQTPVASLALDYGVRAVHTNPFDVIGAFQFAFQTF